MNNDQVARVLRMVADGKVSAEDAQQILEALGPAGAEEVAASQKPRNAPSTQKIAIGVSEAGTLIAQTVVPIALFRSDRQFLPRQVRHYLGEFQIDLDQLLERAEDLGLTGTITDLSDGDVNIWIAVK